MVEFLSSTRTFSAGEEGTEEWISPLCLCIQDHHHQAQIIASVQFSAGVHRRLKAICGQMFLVAFSSLAELGGEVLEIQECLSLDV